MFNPFDKKYIAPGKNIYLDDHYAEIVSVESLHDDYAICGLIVDGLAGQFKVEYCWSSLEYGPHYLIETDLPFYDKNVFPKMKSNEVWLLIKNLISREVYY